MTEHVGCSVRVSTPELFDCKAGLRHWRVGWSLPKQKWCCIQKGMGCTSAFHPTSVYPYDCQAGYANWKKGWSAAKIKWCCAHRTGGCTEPDAASTPLPEMKSSYNCLDGYADWLNSWDDNKKTWCCAHKHVACMRDVAPVPAVVPAVATTIAPPPAPQQKTAASNGCDAECVVKGEARGCGERIQWAATNSFVFLPKVESCQSAQSLVIKECPHCTGCNAANSGCAHAVR